MEYDKTHTVRLRAFYTRRILRIWPLYFFVLVIGVTLSISPAHWHLTPNCIIAFLFLAGNIYTALYNFPYNPISPLWSVSIEEQFYLVVPSIIKYGGLKLLTWASGIILVVSYCLLCWMGLRHVSLEPRIWSDSLINFQFFAGGSLSAIILKGKTPQLAIPARFGLFLGGCACWLLADSVGLSGRYYATGPISLVAGYALVLFGTATIFFAFLGIHFPIPRSLRYLGKISYGLYAFHMFAIFTFHSVFSQKHNPLLIGVLDFGSTVLIAALSYHFLETPFLKLKDRFAVIHSRPV